MLYACCPAHETLSHLATGDTVIKCPSPLKVLKDAYYHRTYSERLDEYQHLMKDSPWACPTRFVSLAAFPPQVLRPGARKVSGWSKIYKLAPAFLWEYS
jgi:hypothetical protein